jgi:hypothetical protein
MLLDRAFFIIFQRSKRPNGFLRARTLSQDSAISIYSCEPRPCRTTVTARPDDGKVTTTQTMQEAKTMKDIVITVVNFFAWVVIIVATVVGYFATKGSYEYIGALIGFALGCLGSGVWFVLSVVVN